MLTSARHLTSPGMLTGEAPAPAEHRPSTRSSTPTHKVNGPDPLRLPQPVLVVRSADCCHPLCSGTHKRYSSGMLAAPPLVCSTTKGISLPVSSDEIAEVQDFQLFKIGRPPGQHASADCPTQCGLRHGRLHPSAGLSPSQVCPLATPHTLRRLTSYFCLYI